MVKTFMNVDPQEIQKFDALAHDWWDPEGPFKPLHDLNPLRLAFIQNGCTLANQNIVDVGCGGGILTEALAQFSQQVTGLDQAQAVLAIAKEHAKPLANPPHYECITIEEYASKHAGTVDVITCMEMLEHVPDPYATVEALSTLLKPGGHLFCSTLNRTPTAFLKAIIGAEYILRLLPKGTHDYARFIRPSELTQWANMSQLSLKKMKGISYHLLSKTFSLSTDVSVNYLIHFTKDSIA